MPSEKNLRGMHYLSVKANWNLQAGHSCVTTRSHNGCYRALNGFWHHGVLDLCYCDLILFILLREGQVNMFLLFKLKRYSCYMLQPEALTARCHQK